MFEQASEGSRSVDALALGETAEVGPGHMSVPGSVEAGVDSLGQG